MLYDFLMVSINSRGHELRWLRTILDSTFSSRRYNPNYLDRVPRRNVYNILTGRGSLTMQ